MIKIKEKKKGTRIISVDELAKMLKGPNVLWVPPLLYQLEKMPPEIRAFYEPKKDNIETTKSDQHPRSIIHSFIEKLRNV
jgi:hypothetical protein